jgi:hypothetical protein
MESTDEPRTPYAVRKEESAQERVEGQRKRPQAPANWKKFPMAKAGIFTQGNK